LLELAQAILAGDAGPALGLLDQLARSGKDLGRLLGDLLNHFRNLLIFQVSRGDKSLLEVSEAEMAALVAQASQIETEQLTRVLEVLSYAEGRQRDSASKRIFLEVTLLKAIQAREASSLDAVLKQLRALREGAGPAAAPAIRASAAPAPLTPAPPAPAPASVVAPPTVAPPPSPAPPAAAPTAAPLPALSGGESAEGIWTSLVAAFAGEPLFRAQLSSGQPQSLVGRKLAIGFPEDDFELLNTSRTTALLAAKLSELGVGDVVVKLVPLKSAAPALELSRPAAAAPRPAPVAKPPEAKPAKPAPLQLNKEEFANDPAIKAALEIFKATLIEVRAPAPAEGAA
jgi:DNA polymerase-3 subunit gamma/tau